MNRRREKLLQHMKDKDILIYGVGDLAIQFYKDYCDELHIVGCISDNKKNRKFIVDDTEICEVKPMRDVQKSDSQLIIVCEVEVQAVEQQLSAWGYRYGQDYMSAEVYRILSSEKKIALFYGVCYVDAMHTCLQSSESFRQEYNSFSWLEYIAMSAINKELYGLILAICDLYVYNAFVSKEKMRLNEAYVARLQTECQQIRIPVLHFNGYHPRKKGYTGDTNPYSITPDKASFAPFSNEDEVLNGLIDEGYALSDIKKIVNDINLYDREWLQQNYEIEISRMQMAERFSDIPISDYVVEHHGKKRLFLSETQLSNDVIIEMSNRVLDKLKLNRDVSEQMRDVRLLQTSELPVYPSVVEGLGLEVYQNHPKYCFCTFQGDKMLTFDEYVEIYYEYCTGVKRLMEEGYLPRK